MSAKRRGQDDDFQASLHCIALHCALPYSTDTEIPRSLSCTERCITRNRVGSDMIARVMYIFRTCKFYVLKNAQAAWLLHSRLAAGNSGHSKPYVSTRFFRLLGLYDFAGSNDALPHSYTSMRMQ